MPSQSRPLRAAGTARLDDVFLQVAGIDPDAEAREGAVLEPSSRSSTASASDGALVDDPFLALRHAHDPNSLPAGP